MANIQEWWKANDTPAIEAAKAELVRLAPELVVMLGLQQTKTGKLVPCQIKHSNMTGRRFPYSTVYSIALDGDNSRPIGPFDNKAAARRYAKTYQIQIAEAK